MKIEDTRKPFKTTIGAMKFGDVFVDSAGTPFLLLRNNPSYTNGRQAFNLKMNEEVCLDGSACYQVVDAKVVIS